MRKEYQRGKIGAISSITPFIHHFKRLTKTALPNSVFRILCFFEGDGNQKRHDLIAVCHLHLAAGLGQQAMQGDSGRWQIIKVDNFYIKTQLGLSNFRVCTYEAVDQYMAIVLLTRAYVESRFEQKRCAQIKTYGDLIRRHRAIYSIGSSG